MGRGGGTWPGQLGGTGRHTLCGVLDLARTSCPLRHAPTSTTTTTPTTRTTAILTSHIGLGGPGMVNAGQWCAGVRGKGRGEHARVPWLEPPPAHHPHTMGGQN